MISQQHIPCPVCQTSIPFEARELVMGKKFACPGCSAVVGIANDQLDIASQAMEKYEALKQFANKTKQQKQS